MPCNKCGQFVGGYVQLCDKCSWGKNYEVLKSTIDMNDDTKAYLKLEPEIEKMIREIHAMLLDKQA